MPIIDGYVISQKPWSNKGRVAVVQADDGSQRTVGFSYDLRVPKLNVKVRIEGNQGATWLFAEKWEYLTPPPGRTPGKFPIRGDSELEAEALTIIRSLDEFTADDLHRLEELIAAKGRDRRVIGSILKKFERQGWIKPARIVKSKRKECHSRPIVLWTRTVTLDRLM